MKKPIMSVYRLKTLIYQYFRGVKPITHNVWLRVIIKVEINRKNIGEKGNISKG